MQGYLDICVSCYEDDKSKEAYKQFKILRRKYKQFRNKDKEIPWDDIFFTIPENDKAITEIYEVGKAFPSTIEVTADMWLEYSEEEARTFPAFIPQFRGHYCEEYDDVEYVYDECNYCESKYCFRESILWNDKSYGNVKLILPDGYIKRNRDKCVVMDIDSGDNVNLISVPLRNELMRLGNNENSFKNVVTKRGKTVAYEFYEEVVLPSGVILSERFRGAKCCPVCGRFNFGYENEEGAVPWYHQYEPYYIKEEDLDLLGDVSKTTDCFYGYPMIIVSPRIRRDILKYCPDARFEPVQVKNT